MSLVKRARTGMHMGSKTITRVRLQRRGTKPEEEDEAAVPGQDQEMAT